MMIITQTLSRKRTCQLPARGNQMPCQRKRVLLHHPFHCYNCQSKTKKYLLVPLHLMMWLMLRTIARKLLSSSSNWNNQNFITLLERVGSTKLVSDSLEQACLEYHTLPKLVYMVAAIREEALVIWSVCITSKPSKTSKVQILLLENAQTVEKCSMKLVRYKHK